MFRPGEGKLLAFTAAPVKHVQITAAAPRLIAGQPLTLSLQVLDEAGRPVPGAFPFELRVSCGDEEIAGLARSFSAQSGQTVTLQTALSDPSGSWAIEVRDGITGLEGTAAIEVAAALRRDSQRGLFPGAGPPNLKNRACYLRTSS